MKEIYLYVVKHFLTKEFLLFLIVGVINTFNGTFLAWLYGFIFANPNLAFNLGYITSNIIAYLLNSIFIFPTKLSIRRLIKFFISYIPNYIMQNVLVVISYNILGIDPIISYIIAAIVAFPLTFLLVKIFAFNKK